MFPLAASINLPFQLGPVKEETKTQLGREDFFSSFPPMKKKRNKRNARPTEKNVTKRASFCQWKTLLNSTAGERYLGERKGLFFTSGSSEKKRRTFFECAYFERDLDLPLLSTKTHWPVSARSYFYPLGERSASAEMQKWDQIEGPWNSRPMHCMFALPILSAREAIKWAQNALLPAKCFLNPFVSLHTRSGFCC